MHRHHAVASYMVGAQRALELAAARTAQHAALTHSFAMPVNLPHELMATASTTGAGGPLPGVHAPSHPRIERGRSTGRNPQVSSGNAAVAQPRHDYLDQMDSRQNRQLDKLARASGGRPSAGARGGLHDSPPRLF
jgi:hypothetical protein